jgi:hypothetical protein
MPRNNDDFLEAMGMSKGEQKAATMKAATFNPSDFEGTYDDQGLSYNSKGANLLKRVIGEVKDRREDKDNK